MARSKKPTVVTPSSDTKPAITEPVALPAVTFSPEALSTMLNEITESRKVIAELKEAVASAALAINAKNAKGSAKAPTLSIAGKSDRSLRNEIDVVKAFKKAGYGNVTPHVDVRTFNRWVADNRRPIEGSKSLTVGNLRLFHVSQTREITSAEKAANVEQQKAAIDRHTAKGKTATVHHLPQ